MTAARALDRVCGGLATLAAAGLAAIAGGIVFQASARSLGFSGSSHVFTFTEFGLLYIAMFASPWLVAERGHVFIELLAAAVPARARGALWRGVAGLSVVICAVLAWYTGEATLRAWALGDTVMRSLDMPRWLLLGAMPLCFGLMAAQFVRFAVGPATMQAPPGGATDAAAAGTRALP